ncbi:unnamed protein product [Schistocephalus solidus]|uniref:Reticulon-like protein n=1 Tax=Schistocephalus solidus TaxID=70667 RepID=A0A183T859_SCHSO|nr:unnamed protein product [Schistocephalus solidus]
MDKIFSVMDNPPSFQSDSSVYGSSSLEFIIPPSKPPMRVAEVVSERNVRPSELPTEMDLRVLDLIYWRRPYISAIVFITAMVLELGLLMYSVISVISNFLLALLFMAVGTRLYFRIINAPEASPLNALGKLNCRLSPTVSAELVQVLTARLNYGMVIVRDLFLLRSLSDSMKFGAVLYSLTYIGARFNFLTLCILVLLNAPPLRSHIHRPIHKNLNRFFLQRSMSYSGCRVGMREEDYMGLCRPSRKKVVAVGKKHGKAHAIIKRKQGNNH